MKQILSHSGTTTDNKMVLSGSFSLVGTYGIPLDLVLSYFKENNIVIDWKDYIQMAIADGQNPKRLAGKIMENIQEVYSLEYSSEFERRLDKLLTELGHQC